MPTNEEDATEPVDGSQTPGSMRAALADRNIRLLILARTMSEFGSGATMGTLLLLLSIWTHSAKDVSLNALAQAVPSVLLGWFAGALVDRSDRRAICVRADVARGLAVLLYIFVPAGRIDVVLGITAFQASVGAFFMPASSALTPLIVPPKYRAAVIGGMQSLMMAADLVGVSLAGLLVATGDHRLAFAVDAATFFLAAALVGMVRVHAVAAPDGSPQSTLGAIRDGLHFVGRTPVILATVVAAVASMISFAAINVLQAPLLVTVLHASPAWLGAVSLCFVGSAVALGLVVRRLVQRFTAPGMVILGLSTGAVGAAALAFAWTPAVICGAAIFMGAAQTLTGTGGSLIAQDRVPDAMRGRVAAVVMSLSDGGSLAALAIVAALAATVGTRGLIVAAAGFLAVGCVPVALMYSRSAIRVEASATAQAQQN